ncbi:molybdopterin-dependent oxidoreductase [Halococcus thailandensis]|uniref:Sulfite oxidase-like oxidoreductase n=1 Tax=Halococcus thailandensis JCM 13552 TaxID=1227457 RepID=M0N0W3_9EURY|nr:molybdopterin-dependent oxidoreductase [Halococcus thailandensis]EMA51193.1 sulfite oxidase-like oxidoreductase [Halococcus thailandensis JCM 13552]
MSHVSTDGSFAPAIVTAVFAGIAGIVGSYALAGYTPSFVVAPITAVLAQNVPAALLTFAKGPLTQFGQAFGIEHLGQQVNLLLALAIGTGLFACLTLAALATGRQLGTATLSIGLTGVLVALATVIVAGAIVPALGAGVASALVVAIAIATTTGTERQAGVSTGRRSMLGSLAGTLGIGVLGYTLGSSGEAGDSVAASTGAAGGSNTGGGGSDGTNASGGANASSGGGPSAGQLLSKAESASFGISGLEGLVSGEDFYEVDTANVNPDVNANDWSLSLTGAVGNERTVDYDQLTSMASELRFMTLRCVSDPLNGDKMGNALWEGVPVRKLLDTANLQGKYVMARSDDGYFEEFPVEALTTGMLAYGKDGNPLPRKHGHPVRLLVPGHWGEINVKWIDELEILNRPAKGFWEKRGWHGTGPANTVAKLYATNKGDDEITVAGHANAGTRGIRKVEVSTDGGSSWNEARLSDVLEPNLGGDVWRQWAYSYEPPGGKHEVVVRAIDGSGTTQPKKNSGPYPRGASGWVSKTVE